ncbi:MAG TPA: oligoribonuclease [Egibacteraceae bacterium]|nr:oligoribonuclease [Actinomycetota bacterium]HWB72711.1 oligoribonuclease [Egibacteraceae bacterium]
MDQPLVWVDLEMTGLDPARDAVLEIATVVTDGALERLVEGPDLVVAQPEDVLAAMEPVVADMHAKSGLVEAVRRQGIPLAEAQRRTLAFVRAHVPEADSAPLAGNSIHADRMFLRKHLPELEAWLHYRNVDVSTVKELARRWYPAVYDAAPVKGGGHRALADIRESITELRYYRQRLFR